MLVMKGLMPLLAVKLVLLSACTSPTASWVQAGHTKEALNRDLYECSQKMQIASRDRYGQSTSYPGHRGISLENHPFPVIADRGGQRVEGGDFGEKLVFEQGYFDRCMAAKGYHRAGTQGKAGEK